MTLSRGAGDEHEDAGEALSSRMRIGAEAGIVNRALPDYGTDRDEDLGR